MTFIKEFEKYGFIEFEDIFSTENIDDINKKVDPIIAYKFTKEKTEILLQDLIKTGIVDIVLSNNNVRNIILQIMPDPVLCEFNIYEVDSFQARTHTNDNTLNGWHPDIPELPFLNRKLPNFISFMIYLTDVLDFSDGPFEITSENNIKNINHNLLSKKILGKKGTSFIWNNNYIHRGSPNSGKNRRRVLKFSFQNNYIQNNFYPRLQEAYIDVINKDDFTNFVFGKFHKTSLKGHNIAHLLKNTISFNKFKKIEFNTNIEISKKIRITKFIKKIFN
jgi:hypothetical protein